MDFRNLKLGLVLILGLVLGILVSHYSGRIFRGQPLPIDPPKNDAGSEYDHRQIISPADYSKLFPKLVFRGKNNKPTALALTFDDGPDLRYTPKILDILKKYKIKATFFVNGIQINKYRATFKRMIKEGHEIGSHSFQHLKLPDLKPSEIQYQMRKNNEIIQANGGPKRVALFRPPYGAIDPATIRTIEKMNYRIVLWTIDSLDWRSFDKQRIKNNILPLIRNGYIVLQHCAAFGKSENLNGSVAALPDIITTAQKKGYKFITISELIKTQVGR